MNPPSIYFKNSALKNLFYNKITIFRFVYLRDKKEALNILNGIAAINRKTLLTDDSLEDWDVDHIKKHIDQRKYTLIDLFRYKSLCLSTVVLMLTHFFIEIFYWGTGFALPSLGTSIYLNIFLFGLIEMISYIGAGKNIYDAHLSNKYLRDLH